MSKPSERTSINLPICRWCMKHGDPEWSTSAKVWIHRLPQLDRVCENERPEPSLKPSVAAVNQALYEALRKIVRIRPENLCWDRIDHYPESCIWCKGRAALKLYEEGL